ncbi:MAG: 3-methyl-2-oxobutanoate hydroxymethyltransferase [Gemmataceae bacterium]|nr:3-methyl-2-oxobutanoate hydroxymethyltransferase [Gemmataceae bacterium]
MVAPDAKPVTVPDFQAAKSRGSRLTMVTCYDYATSRLLDATSVDALLVGDSLGMVIQGHPNSLSVTLDDVVYHTRCVARGAARALIVADMPFLTYQINADEALRHAGRLIQEGGAHAVKLEGGRRMAATIERIVAADIPVMGHVGLTPQSIRRLGGFRVQRDEAAIFEDARAVADAGAFAVVLECIPAGLARRITESLPIPTIGIGAGAGCDGQVLVLHDLLGMFDDLQPRFVKRYAELGQTLRAAVQQYCEEVRAGKFPGPEHEFR